METITEDQTHLGDQTYSSNEQDKLKDFYTKFDKYIEKKYKPSETIVRPLSYVTPAIISFIGAYGLLIECIANTIISLVKDMPVCKQLAIKCFITFINCYEIIIGTKLFFTNLTDENTNRMLTSSFNDFLNKIKNSSENISKLLIENCDELIDEKINEFSDVD